MKETQEQLRKILVSIYECASAWDNDDGKMAEANEKTPEDILAETIEKASFKGMEESRVMLMEVLAEVEKEHGTPNVYFDMIEELFTEKIDNLISPPDNIK